MTEIESVEAGTHFSDVLQRVRDRGEAFVVTEHGEPVATIQPSAKEPQLRGQELKALLEELRHFRAKIALRGPILKPGETWKEFAREGLE